MTPHPPAPTSRISDAVFLGGLAVLKIAVHLPFLGRYGYHHDELYFLACGRHLDWGYVDHPPLVPWIARLADALFGQSVVGLRLFALGAGTAAVVLTALLTRRLGGGRVAQATAALAMLAAPVFMRTSNLFCIPAFELPLWVAGCYLVVRILQEDRPRLWLGVGVVAGLGLLTKHTMLLFGFGLAAGLLLTPARRQLKSAWLYAGAGVALLLFLPNLIWQATHGWPTVEFLRNLNRGTMSGISVLQFSLGQVLYLNPLAAPIWIGGLIFFFSKAGQRFRVFAWMYAVIFVLLLVAKSKIYYLHAAYPVLLAGGGVALERLARRRAGPWLRRVTIGALIVGAALFLPVSVPILSIGGLDRYVGALTFGAFKNVYELTGDLHGMFGWRERVRTTARVWNRLAPAERKRAVIFAPWYGPAAAIDYFGKAHGLPGAVSGHMTYHLWGLPAGPIDTVVFLSDRPRLERLRKIFSDVTIAAQTRLEDVNPWERRFFVILCRKPKTDFHQLWPTLRRW